MAFPCPRLDLRRGIGGPGHGANLEQRRAGDRAQDASPAPLDPFAALIHADIWGSGNFASVPILNKLLQDYGITPAARSQIMPAEVQKQERHTPLDEIAERRKLRVIQGGKAKRRTGT